MANPVPLMCSLGGHTYMFDKRKYSRRTLQGLALQQIASPEGGDADLNREGFWRRSQSRFGYGAGQAFFDDDGANRRRFYTSKGINIWDDRSITLLNDTEQKKSSANTNLYMLVTGSYLYMADGITLRFTSDPTPSSPTFSSPVLGGSAIAITGMVTDGQYVYITATVPGSSSSGFRATVGSATTPINVWATGAVGIFGYGNGRLIAGGYGATSNDLWEVDGTGNKSGGVNIRSDGRGGTWAAIVGTPSAIFAAYNVGNVTEFYALTADNTSTALTAVYAGALPIGETCTSLAFYGGVVVIGTTSGFRVATIGSGNALDYGQLVTIPNGVNCFAPYGEFVWFGWTNFDGTSTGLGRMDLAINTSTDTLVPGYASDAMATTQGTVQGCAAINGRRYFTVSGHGLYGENANLVPSGTINSGWIRYSTLVPKIFSGVQVGFDALVGSVSISLVTEEGTVHALGTASTAGTTESTFFDASTLEGIAGQVQLTLTRATTTTGPTVRYWILDSIPVPPRITEIILPIILSAKVNDLQGNEVTYDPLTEYQFLDGLRRANELVDYFEGDLSDSVRVADMGINPGDAMTWENMHPTGGRSPAKWFERVTLSVRLLTKEA